VNKEEIILYVENEIRYVFEALFDDMKWENTNDPRIDKLMPAEILLTNVWRQFVEKEI